MTKKQLSNIYTGTINADEEVLANAPVETNGKLDFFNVGKHISDDSLAEEYKSRHLVPASIYQLAVWCEANKDDDRKYFATHWKDSKGKWCYAAFDRWDGGRSVSVGRSGYGWDDDWWFAGLRNDTLNSEPMHKPLESLVLKPCEHKFVLSQLALQASPSTVGTALYRNVAYVVCEHCGEVRKTYDPR